MINTEQLLQFTQNHWALCLALGVALALLVYEEFKSIHKVGGITKIAVLDATLLLNHENAVIVDLRNKKAFMAGHILGSINIEPADFDAHVKKIEPHKKHNIILLSDTDTDAVSIGKKLQKQEFFNVNILSGGLQAWKNVNLPLTTR